MARRNEMNEQEEIQTAFVLWKKLREMEYHLRSLYDNEFLKLAKNDPSLLPPGATIDDFIPF
jgi:hypothetical protein